MKNKLETILKGIVDKEDEVEVIESNDNGAVNLTIKVNSEEMGRVIGKGGKVIKAIRNVMKIIAMKENVKVFVNLYEPNES